MNYVGFYSAVAFKRTVVNGFSVCGLTDKWSVCPSIRSSLFSLRWPQRFFCCFVYFDKIHFHKFMLEIKNFFLTWVSTFTDITAGLAVHWTVSGEAAGGDHCSVNPICQPSSTNSQFYQSWLGRQGTQMFWFIFSIHFSSKMFIFYAEKSKQTLF